METLCPTTIDIPAACHQDQVSFVIFDFGSKEFKNLVSLGGIQRLQWQEQLCLSFYKDRLKNSSDNVISTVDDIFDQWKKFSLVL